MASTFLCTCGTTTPSLFVPLIQTIQYLYCRIVSWLPVETLENLINKKENQDTGNGGFGANIKINPPVFIDYSNVKLPEKSRQRHRSIDIKYQPPKPVKGERSYCCP